MDMMKISHAWGCGVPQRVGAVLSGFPLVEIPLGSCISTWNLEEGKRRSIRQLYAGSGGICGLKTAKSSLADDQELIVTVTYGGEIKVWKQGWELVAEALLLKDASSKINDISFDGKSVLVSSIGAEQALTCLTLQPSLGSKSSLSDTLSFTLVMSWKIPGCFNYHDFLRRNHEGDDVCDLMVVALEQDRGETGVLNLFHSETGARVNYKQLSHSGHCTSFLVVADGTMVVLGLTQKHLLLLDAKKLETVSTVELEGSTPRCILYDEKFGGRLFVSCEGSKLNILEFPSLRPISCETYSTSVLLQWLPDLSSSCFPSSTSSSSSSCSSSCSPLRYLLSGTHSSLNLVAYDSVSFSTVKTIKYHSLTCCGVVISDCGTFVASGDFASNVFVWSLNQDTAIETPLFSLSANNSAIRALAWTKHFLVVGAIEGRIYYWNSLLPQSKLELAAKIPRGALLTMKVSNSGSHLAVAGSTGHVWLYSIESSSTQDSLSFILEHECLAHPPIPDCPIPHFGHLSQQCDIWSVAWSPDDGYIATTSEDLTTRIWRTQKKEIHEEEATKHLEHVVTLEGNKAAVTCADWSVHPSDPSCIILATCSDDQTIRVYDGKTFALKFMVSTSFLPGWHTLTYLAFVNKGKNIAVTTQHGYMVVLDAVWPDSHPDTPSSVYPPSLSTYCIKTPMDLTSPLPSMLVPAPLGDPRAMVKNRLLSPYDEDFVPLSKPSSSNSEPTDLILEDGGPSLTRGFVLSCRQVHYGSIEGLAFHPKTNRLASVSSDTSTHVYELAS